MPSMPSSRPLPRVGAGDGHVRHDAHVAFADDLHQLHDRVALRADGVHARAIGFGFRVARGADGFGFAERAQAGGFPPRRSACLMLALACNSAMFTPCSAPTTCCWMSATAVSRTSCWRCFCAASCTSYVLRCSSAIFRSVCVCHQRRRRIDVADERVNGLHVIRRRAASRMCSRGFRLALAAGAQEVEHRVVLRRIAEIISDNRLQHMVHQVLHRTHARDHLRRVERADVDDLRDIQVEREPIARAHRDGRQFGVVSYATPCGWPSSARCSWSARVRLSSRAY